MGCLARYFLLGVLVLLPVGPNLKAQPYFTVDQIDRAEEQARARHLPIAWLSSPMVYLNAAYANDGQGSAAELTALALRTLQGQAVIIFQDADNDLSRMPANMVARIETKDEGDHIPGGGHYTAPKIIYTDPDLTTFFGCTLAPDLRRDREAAINIALIHVQNDPQAQALLKGTAKPPAPAASPPTPPPAQTPPDFFASIDKTYLGLGAITVLVIMGFLVLHGRGRHDGA